MSKKFETVGDDGSQAEKDERRKYKPTGFLFIKRDVNPLITEDYIPAIYCKIIE